MRSVRYQMSAARFPVHRDRLASSSSNAVRRAQADHRVVRLAFTDDAHNVVSHRRPGTGKTHLATALGVSGITATHGCALLDELDLVNALEQEKVAGKAAAWPYRCANIDLVILDEPGYLPLARQEAPLLFHLLSKPLRAHQRDDHDQPGLRRMGPACSVTRR